MIIMEIARKLYYKLLMLRFLPEIKAIKSEGSASTEQSQGGEEVSSGNNPEESKPAESSEGKTLYESNFIIILPACRWTSFKVKPPSLE